MDASDPLLGTVIERYRLERLLGEGGMGRVYLGVQPAIGSRVAIKILSDECARNAELLDRFFAEAKAVNLIRHESIISVLDLAVLRDGRPYIVMEYIEGHTLAHHVRRTHAPLGGVAQVVGEVLSGLAAAHTIGIVHRDMKPDNVLVTVEGHAKVLDFGIAKLAPGLRPDVSPRTKTGALLGTPAYMAPEQISGAQNVDPRTDIYAVGIVLYEAVTGAVPFSGGTLFDIMRAHLDDTPRPPRELRREIPPSLEAVILQALAKDPNHRFQSANAMAQALAHASSELPADQWKPLSTRGGPRISLSGVPRTTEKDPPTDRDPPSMASAPPTDKDPPSTASAPPTERTHKRRGIVVGTVAALAITAGIVVLVTSSSGKDEPPTGAPTSAAADPAAVPAAAADPAAVAAAAPAPVSAPAPAPVPVPATAPVSAPVSSQNPTRPPRAAQQQQKQPSSVDIGPGVHIGPGVIINGKPATTSTTVTANLPAPAPTSKTRASRPADYDPKRFDPVAYLPKALELAQQLIPDAKLTSFEFDPVFPDGRVDLTMDGRDREYIFRSPSKSARPADIPRNLPYERACMVYVEVGTREVTAVIRASEDCNARIVRHPKCRFVGVWKQALANGTPRDVVARIGWLYDEKWFFDVDLEGKGGGVSSFDDRCP